MAKWKAAEAAAIVTGASSGIGHELALLLARHGASVICVARRQDRLDQLADRAADAAGQIIPMVGDITDHHFRESILSSAHRRWQRLDLLVNNAGIGGIGRFDEASAQRLARILEVNFIAAAELTRLAIPLLRDGNLPVLCNVGSVLGHRAVPGKSEYCASKFAMHGWSDALRAELARDGIQVTLVSPSTTSSEFFDAAIQSGKQREKARSGAMPASRVAELTYKAIVNRKDEVILSAGGKLLVYADRLCPWLMNRILARWG